MNKNHIRVTKDTYVGRFQFTESRVGVQEDGSILLPMGITIDLENDLIEGMLCYDLGQISSTPIQNGTFLDLVFSNASTDS
jgi:hypothetical protein